MSTLASKPRLAPRSRPTGSRVWAEYPFAVSVVVSLAVAALSAAALPTVPSYDPWSWIVWGREVFDPHLSFFVGGGPSWKPLPVIFTAFFGPFGNSAPTLWVITARAGGVLALIAAYRLGSQLVRQGREASGAGDSVASWEPIAAGLLAAAGVLLTQDWFYYMFRGTSEPMLVGLSLWAVDRHLAGRHVLAFVLGVAASLIRPEWWPFIFLYGIWLYRRQPSPWIAVLDPRRLVLDPVLLVRAAVDQHRPATARSDPRPGVQRSTRVRPIRRGEPARGGPPGRALRSCSLWPRSLSPGVSATV